MDSLPQEKISFQPPLQTTQSDEPSFSGKFISKIVTLFQILGLRSKNDFSDETIFCNHEIDKDGNTAGHRALLSGNVLNELDKLRLKNYQFLSELENNEGFSAADLLVSDLISYHVVLSAIKLFRQMSGYFYHPSHLASITDNVQDGPEIRREITESLDQHTKDLAEQQLLDAVNAGLADDQKLTRTELAAMQFVSPAVGGTNGKKPIIADEAIAAARLIGSGSPKRDVASPGPK